MDPSLSATGSILKKREIKNGNPFQFPLLKLEVTNPVLKRSLNGNV